MPTQSLLGQAAQAPGFGASGVHPVMQFQGHSGAGVVVVTSKKQLSTSHVAERKTSENRLIDGVENQQHYIDMRSSHGGQPGLIGAGKSGKLSAH